MWSQIFVNIVFNGVAKLYMYALTMYHLIHINSLQHRVVNLEFILTEVITYKSKIWFLTTQKVLFTELSKYLKAF